MPTRRLPERGSGTTTRFQIDRAVAQRNAVFPMFLHKMKSHTWRFTAHACCELRAKIFRETIARADVIEMRGHNSSSQNFALSTYR